MDPRRVFGAGERENTLDRNEVAARRLALIAAGLGRDTEGRAPSERTCEPLAATDEPWWADHTRVAEPAEQPGGWASVLPLPVRGEPTEPGEPPEPTQPASTRLAPALPTPGRHAARRRGFALAPLVRDRIPALSPAHLAVVALAVAIGLAVTCWWVIRDQPDPLPAGSPVAGEPVEPLVGAGATSSASEAGAPAASAGETQVTVDVAGKVRRPGIVVLDQGARVTDALKAAGGAKRGVDTTSLNLARVLVDGEQIVVGAPAGKAPAAGAPPSSGAAAPGQLVNLNTATASELEALPQVGPVTAQSIVAWRDRNGGFTSVDELLEVDGIGEKTLAQLTPYLTV